MDVKLFSKTSNTLDGNMSLKWGEENEVMQNREQFLSKHGLRLEDCVVMEVEHGDTVLRVDTSHKPKSLTETVTAEALITKEKGVVLFLLTADCLPVVLYDPIHQTLALAHLGWKPTDKKLLLKVIGCMREAYGTEPDRLEVFIGPGIHKESYRHTLPLTSDVVLTALKPFVTPVSSHEVAIDLVGCNRVQLLEAGVREEDIHIDPIDTATSADYFSHYRSVRTGEQEGRFATIAYLKPSI